jgi:hypothetical protein
MGNQLATKFYDIAEISVQKKSQFWKLYQAKTNQDSNEVTLFEFSDSDKLLNECANNALSVRIFKKINN